MLIYSVEFLRLIKIINHDLQQTKTYQMLVCRRYLLIIYRVGHLYKADSVVFVTACKNSSRLVIKSAWNWKYDWSLFWKYAWQKNLLKVLPKWLKLKIKLKTKLSTWWVSNLSVSDGSSRIWKIWKKTIVVFLQFKIKFLKNW